MTIKTFEINVQPLYDLAILGKDVHRPSLDDQAFAMIRARHYTRLENIILKYKDQDGNDVKFNAADNSSEGSVRIKILALYVQTDRYDYSRSSREQLKRKLGIDQISCSSYMPEIIDGRTREWTVDNLEDAINALTK